MWTGFNCVRIRRVAGFCENGNEPSDSIRSAECFDWGTVSFSRRTAIHRLCFGCCCCCCFWWRWSFQVVFYNINSSVPTKPPYPASTGYSLTGLKRPDAEADSSFPSSKAAVNTIATPLPPYASAMLLLSREHLERLTFPILALCWRHFWRRARITFAATLSYPGALQALVVSYQQGLQQWSVCASVDVGSVRTCSNACIYRLQYTPL